MTQLIEMQTYQSLDRHSTWLERRFVSLFLLEWIQFATGGMKPSLVVFPHSLFVIAYHRRYIWHLSELALFAAACVVDSCVYLALIVGRSECQTVCALFLTQ